MKKRPLGGGGGAPCGGGSGGGKRASIADTIARVSGMASMALEPSDEDVARLLALEAAKRRSLARLRAPGAPEALAPAAEKPNINKHFLANTIRSVSSHNRREEEADCWRAHEQQKKAEGGTQGGPRRGRERGRGRGRGRGRSRSRSPSRSPSRSQERPRGRHAAQGDKEDGEEGHRPLKPPPAPRVVRESFGQSREAQAPVDRWERGAALSPPRAGGAPVEGQADDAADDAAASASSSSSTSSSSSSGDGRKRKRSSKRKKESKKRRKSKKAKKAKKKKRGRAE